MNRLSSQNKNFSGEIQGFDGKSELVTRLRELGFVEGDHLYILEEISKNGPLLIEIRGAILALRRNEARCILV